MKYLSFFVYLISAVALAIPQRPADDNLTREFAQYRKTQVQTVAYDLHFTFTETGKDFKGKAVIDVTLNFTDKPLSLDFKNKSIDQLVVNGKVLKAWTKRSGSFDIPASALAKTTKIEVSYTGQFDDTGHGIQRIIDPTDKNVYIYTDMEPYYAHGFYPCFDQPDLKATFKSTITAPTAWKAISNELAISSQASGDQTTTQFQTTPLISTYLFFVGVGPFVQWNDTYGKWPLVLYSRKSLEKYVDAKNIFATTKKGLKFYNEYFGTPYPFSKFGQVFVPEFAWGGMENPGAITLNEDNLFRGPVTQSRLEGRDNLILHEMAHMWFGDLVTMNWWDDLWLNESFATYMAEIAAIREMKAKGGVLSSISSKTWGYWQDQLITTHPIETEVLDTRSSKGNFDGITYAKGGASLKQLHFFVGEKAFQKGVAEYFKKHAWQNTSRADFTNSIAQAAGLNLDQWTKAWLQSAGPHRAQVSFTCEYNKINSFTIEQSTNSSGLLSPHKTLIALYKVDDDELELSSQHEVKYSDKSTSVSELIGKECPDFVFPNLGDHDYALWALDQKSMSHAKLVLQGGTDENTIRLMTWNMLSQMVRDSKLPVLEYFEMALSGLEKEDDQALLAIILGRYSSLKNYYDSYLTLDQRNSLAPRLEKVIFTKLMEQDAKSNLQMTYFDFLVRVSHTTEALNRLSNYLKGEGLPKGFALDQDRRWRIINQLAGYNFAGIQDLIAQEELRDPTSAGIKNAFVAKVAIPDSAQKKDFWNTLKQPQKVPFNTLRSAAGAFHGANHLKLSEGYIKPFFEKVTSINWKNQDELAEVYFEGLFPQNICSRSLLAESQKQMKMAKNLTPLTKRYWLEANDELSKCVSIRKNDTQSYLK